MWARKGVGLVFEGLICRATTGLVVFRRSMTKYEYVKLQSAAFVFSEPFPDM